MTAAEELRREPSEEDQKEIQRIEKQTGYTFQEKTKGDFMNPVLILVFKDKHGLTHNYPAPTQE